MTDSATESMPAGMVTYGQVLGARELPGFANHGETIQENPCLGMTNIVPQSWHPRDGRRRHCDIEMRTSNGQWIVAAEAIYDGECNLESFIVSKQIEDKRVARWIEKYQNKIPNLDCMPMQREWPVQSPLFPWVLLRPSVCEVI